MKQTFLEVHLEASEVRVFELLDGYYVIGGDSAANLQIDLPTMAPRHLALALAWGKLQIEPFVQGVVVNGYEIAESVEVEFPVSVELPGVALLLRQEELVFEDPEKTIPVARRAPTENLDPDRTIAVSRRPPAEAAPVDPDATIVRPRQHGGAQAGGGEGFAPMRGGFRLGAEIARGGMGRIHLGQDSQLKREVAIKISHDAGVDPRFTKEAEVLARLAHPNIVPIIALGVDDDGRPYYAMKLVKGRTLQAIIKALREGDQQAVRDFPLPVLLTIFRKVCDAMAFAHSQKILHRDLKPENIMVGEYGEVLVMDWGLAKIIGAAEEESRRGESGTRRIEDSGDFGMTLDGEVMGSPYYMAPEQARGKIQQLDETSDIYSLGGILYALLTLRPPVEGKTVDEVLTRVKSGQITPMTTTHRGRAGREPGAPAPMERRIPEALQAVTMKAMASLQLHRYPRVEDLAKDIEAYQSGFATKAENASALRQIVLLVKRHKAASTLIALFFVALAGFTLKLAASERVARANEEKALAANEATRRQAAKALMTAAEAAEDFNDPETMREALTQVPEDLRDQTWEYLQRKSNEVDLRVTMPEGGVVTSLSEFPGKPNSFLVSQGSGHISQVDSDTGKITPLWRASNNAGGYLGQVACSPNGRNAALAWYQEGKPPTITMAKIEGGKWQQVPHFTPVELPQGAVTLLKMTPKAVFVLDGSLKFRVLDAETGALLWEKPDIRFFTLTADGLHVDVVNQKTSKLDRLLAADGTLVSEGISPMPNFYAQSAIVFSNRLYDATRVRGGSIRHHSMENGSLKWEIRLDSTKTPFGIAYVSQSQTLGTLIQSSALGWNLDFRDWAGNPRRVCRFFANSQQVFLAGNNSAFAVYFGREIYLWRFLPQPPLLKFGIPGRRHVAVFLAGGGRVLAKQELFDISDPQVGLKKLSEQKNDGIFPGTDRKGERVFVTDGANGATYRFANEQLQELWPAKNLASKAFPIFALHPTEDLVWIGDKILEFSTGKELVSLNLQKDGVQNVVDLNGMRPKSGSWVGSDHLVTPAVVSAGSSEQKMLVLWNAKNGTAVAKSPAPQVSSLEASPDGKWIAEGGTDKRVRIRNPQTLAVEKEFRTHDGPITGLAWHPRLPVLATAAGTVVRLWNTESWKMLEEIQLESAPEATLLDIPGEEGRRLFVTNGGDVKIYEPQSFQKTP